jgi:hypothetical protein
MNRRRRVRTSGERGKVTLELGSAGAQHLQILRDLSRRSEQARLPDPRRPFDDRRGALTPSRGGAQALELLELTLALHERRLYHLHTRIVRPLEARSKHRGVSRVVDARLRRRLRAPPSASYRHGDPSTPLLPVVC